MIQPVARPSGTYYDHPNSVVYSAPQAKATTAGEEIFYNALVSRNGGLRQASSRARGESLFKYTCRAHQCSAPW